ncbi:hypothetical protein KM043_007682 [Ampulex compressa]|nr:hypothetical protein KM043_007682 [Ampulex compressa]
MDVVALQQVPAQADVLGEAALAEVAREVPAAAALVLQVLQEAVPHLVAPAALGTLQGEVLGPEVARVPGPAVRNLVEGQSDETWKKRKRTSALVVDRTCRSIIGADFAPPSGQSSLWQEFSED